MIKRSLFLLVLAACAALLSACDIGGGQPPTNYPLPSAHNTPAPSAAPAYPLPSRTAAATQRETKNINLTTSDNVKLVATLYTPNGKRAPAVLLLHSASGSRKDWDAFAQKLQDSGFVALALDFRGHGESGGSKDWEKMRQDAAAALQYLTAQGLAENNRLFIVGASVGANVALDAAVAQPGVKAVALLSPGLDYYNIKTEGALRVYGNRPILLFASSEDAYAAESQKTLAPLAAGSKEVKLFQNAGHGTEMLKNAGVNDALLNWLREVSG